MKDWKKKLNRALGFLSCAEIHRLTQRADGRGKQSGGELKAVGSSVIDVSLCVSICISVSRNANIEICLKLMSSWWSSYTDAPKVICQKTEFFYNVSTAGFFHPSAKKPFGIFSNLQGPKVKANKAEGRSGQEALATNAVLSQSRKSQLKKSKNLPPFSLASSSPLQKMGTTKFCCACL